LSDLTDEVCALSLERLGLDDRQVIQLVLAAAVSSDDEIQHDPLWPMLVGPSSGGKSAALSLIGATDALAVDDLTAASLLYGERDDEGEFHPAGVLPRVGDRGLIVVPDFSTLLAMSNRGGREQLFSYLRKVYDGELYREISTCPIPLHWKGRVTILAACTSAIDNYGAYGGELGTRFVYLRLAPPSDAEGKVARLRVARGTSRDTEIVQEAARRAIEQARLTLPSITVSDDLADLLDIGATVCAYGRTSVPRDGYRRDVVGLAETEEPFRVRNQLDALARCALALGMDAERIDALCCRVARDTMPQVRRDALQVLVDATTAVTSQDVARATSANWHVANRALEDLELANVVARDDPVAGDRQPQRWRVVDGSAEYIQRVFAKKPSRDV
jgi:hypothetical protein